MFWINLFLATLAISVWTSLILWQCKKSIHEWVLTYFYRSPRIPKEQQLGFTHIFPVHKKQEKENGKEDP